MYNDGMRKRIIG